MPLRRPVGDPHHRGRLRRRVEKMRAPLPTSLRISYQAEPRRMYQGWRL